eukprot:367400-Pyramimonas_sp.AAC.1
MAPAAAVAAAAARAAQASAPAGGFLEAFKRLKRKALWGGAAPCPTSALRCRKIKPPPSALTP